MSRQGAERDIIIVSCCRTDRLGFITSPRRLNVTLTRARHHLMVVGSRTALSTNAVWKAVISSAGLTPVRDRTARATLTALAVCACCCYGTISYFLGLLACCRRQGGVRSTVTRPLLPVVQVGTAVTGQASAAAQCAPYDGGADSGADDVFEDIPSSLDFDDDEP